MELLQEITKPYLRNDLPSLEVGYKVKVFTGQLFKSDKKYNFFSFEGIIIKEKRKKQLNYAFTVINGESKIVIEQIFFYHSPLIAKIEILEKHKFRRANLSFLKKKLTAKKANE